MSEITNGEVVSSTTGVEKVTLKDLLVPISVVIAGVCIGAGLYFGGTPTPTPTPAAPTPVAQGGVQPEAVDTTSKIDPVTDKDYIKGSINAPVKIVEYSDFECPFCKRHHDTVKTVFDKLGGENIAWVFRNFPLEQLHPVKAMAAAVGAECAGELGGNDAFWKFTDGYFANTLSGNRTDTDTLIPKLGAEAGLNSQAFTSCLTSGRHDARIQAQIADAIETGGRGTPWSVIIGPTGKTYPVNGALPASAIEQIIQLALDEA